MMIYNAVMRRDEVTTKRFQIRIIELLTIMAVIASALFSRQFGMAGAGVIVGGLIPSIIGRAFVWRSQWIVIACICGMFIGFVVGVTIDSHTKL